MLAPTSDCYLTLQHHSNKNCRRNTWMSVSKTPAIQVQLSVFITTHKTASFSYENNDSTSITATLCKAPFLRLCIFNIVNLNSCYHDRTSQPKA